MQTILVAGAGKSSVYLIQYLLSHAGRENWKIIVADGSREAIEEKVKNSPYAEVAVLDITNDAERQALVKRADLVMSLMPPHLHIHLAKDCLELNKNLITSSYVSQEMKEMDAAVKAKGLMFMCEMGLDPGIDHMTASDIFYSIAKVGGTVTSFKSYCGGLIAPESDDNPWHYKFTWNPKNIISAGFGGAKYLEKGKNVEVPYEKLFDHNKKIQVDGLGQLAYYANRDSLGYLDKYDVPEVKTFLRATLRHPDFCKGWKAMIDLGLTKEDDELNGYTNCREWISGKTEYKNGVSLNEHIANRLGVKADSGVMHMVDWIGLTGDNAIPQGAKNSGAALLGVLLPKWEMKSEDKDMVVMQHEVIYNHRSGETKLTSTMVLKGENRDYSAMAKTVGLPMAILARQILRKKITPPTGVLIPTMQSVYRPVLNELKHHGIQFKETVV